MIHDAVTVIAEEDETEREPSQACRRNLGVAILLVAIKDYCCLDREIHEDAAQFLFPVEREQQAHYDWALSFATGLNPEWLRETLDRKRGQWDAQRLIRKAVRGRRKA